MSDVEEVGLFKVTEPGCHPDLRCDGTVRLIDEHYGIDCVLHHEHDGDHTDGDGTFWDDNGAVDYR